MMALRKTIKAGSVAVATAALLLAGSVTANAAQGGRDGDHYWIKVSANEASAGPGGFNNACYRINGLGRNASCAHLTPLLEAQKRAHPRANGYWAEWYYQSGRTRSGVW